MKHAFLKKNWPVMLLMAFAAIGITVTGIVYEQAFLRILPLYISLVISLLQTRVNRYASLMGGINSILYALVYLYYHLYASAAYALLVSCPIQIVTFIRWSKNKWKETTVLRTLTWKQRLLTALGFAVVWLGLWLLLSLTDANYALLDTTVSLLGILTSFLMMFAFTEYTGLMVLGCVINIVLYITMMRDTPEQSTYLVYTLYSFVCCCIAYVRARKVYVQQQKEQAAQ